MTRLQPVPDAARYRLGSWRRRFWLSFIIRVKDGKGVDENGEPAILPLFPLLVVRS